MIRSAIGLLVILSAGCAARAAAVNPGAVNPPDHLSPEHVPPWANPRTEAEHVALMNAALEPAPIEPAAGAAEASPEAAAVIQTAQAMNAEHAELGDEERHDFEDLNECCFAGRPIDLVPAAHPSDWNMHEDRRNARGSSLDWVPIGMLNDRVVVAPLPAAGTERVVDRGAAPGVVLPADASGTVCVDAVAQGETYRACLAVAELRRLLHGKEER